MEASEDFDNVNLDNDYDHISINDSDSDDNSCDDDNGDVSGIDEYGDFDEEEKHVSNDKVEKGSEASSPGKNDKDAMKEELSELKSTMKYIKETVENMAKIIVSNNSSLTFTTSPNGVPIIVSNSSTPLTAPMPETKTESFKNKQASPTMNARAFEQSSNGTPETQMRKRLFNHEKNAKS
ncbi:hypothetical protein RIF29_09997 [Crotalaria pallida]|uniref:Uncharacterized protein n=1 Tax=Crotalaria pallida TaxID=3830 RepID=A0AAN9FVI7_CROPI